VSAPAAGPRAAGPPAAGAPAARAAASDAELAARWRRLTAVSRAATTATTADDLLRLTVEQAADLLDAERAVVLLLNDDGVLDVRAAHGVAPELVERFRTAGGGPLDETLIARLQGLLGPHDAAAFLGVPLVVRGGVIGLVAVCRATSALVTEDEEAMLSALADQMAAPLEVARLDGELRRGLRLAKDKALAALSHDLRTPLQAIVGFAQLVEEEVLGPVTAEQRGALARIRMSGGHLRSLQESMLEFARLGDGAAAPALGPVDVARVAADALAIVSEDARAHALGAQVAPGLVALADADRLRRVLINLLGNAVRYTPAGGRVTVRAARTGDARRPVAVAVEDTGVGIAADQLEAVFEPYYRLPGAARMAAGGAGLGLAICRELVEQMGGTIVVASAEGAGSTFTVLLPGV
jgi:signal transduction histidine kinase